MLNGAGNAQAISQRSAAAESASAIDREPATLGELFFDFAAEHDRDHALNFKADGRWQKISSAQMLTRAGNIALALDALGLRRGDRAAILAVNSPLWTLADAGCQLAGITDVPIYTTLEPSSIAFILKNSGSRILFIQNAETFYRISDILGDCPELEKIIVLDKSAVKNDRMMSIDNLESIGDAVRQARPELLGELVRAATPQDVATLIYTSGTTGQPKGVMLSHANILSNVADCGENFAFSSADVPLSVLPLSHIFERSAMYVYIRRGMAVYFAESVDKIPENLREVRPTLFIGVPRIFEKVYARAKLAAARAGGIRERIFDWAIETAKEFAMCGELRKPVSLSLKLRHFAADRLVYSRLRDFFGGRLRFCITGGAALPNDIYLIFTGAGISIMQGYGLTETSPVISTNTPLDYKLGTVGKPIRNCSVRTADDGEIEVRGPGVMLGYYKNDAANSEVFTTDGWFRTGDIGMIDEDGFLTITDRKKELFKTSGGKYIAPSPIEQMIRSSRFVSQAVLVGSERKFASALIVPNFEMLASYARHKGLELTTPSDFCNNAAIVDLIERQVAAATTGLARFETVKKIALLENELTVESGELTPTLKIKRRVIDQKYKAVIDQLYA